MPQDPSSFVILISASLKMCDTSVNVQFGKTMTVHEEQRNRMVLRVNVEKRWFAIKGKITGGYIRYKQ